MAIQHRDIPDNELHEPKGIVSAPVDTVYVATGTGTGEYKKLTINSLSGTTGAAPGQILTVGAGGTIVPVSENFAVGNMVVTNNLNGFPVTAAADSSLSSNADYKLYTGNGAPWTAGEMQQGVVFDTDRLIVTIPGIYRAEVWCDIEGFPTNTASVALKYRISGTLMGPRKAKVKSNSGGDSGGLNAFSFVTLDENDYIQIMFASTNNGNLLVGSMAVALTLIQRT